MPFHHHENAEGPEGIHGGKTFHGGIIKEKMPLLPFDLHQGDHKDYLKRGLRTSYGFFV